MGRLLRCFKTVGTFTGSQSIKRFERKLFTTNSNLSGR